MLLCNLCLIEPNTSTRTRSPNQHPVLAPKSGGSQVLSEKRQVLQTKSTSLEVYVRGNFCVREGAQQCFFFLTNFHDLKNVILTNTKDFSWEKWFKFRKEKNSNRQIFTISSSRQSRIQKDPGFFLFSYLACSQNWLNQFLDGRHLGYITKILTKKNPGAEYSAFWI